MLFWAPLFLWSIAFRATTELPAAFFHTQHADRLGGAR